MSLPRKMNELDYETGEVIRTFNSMQQVADYHDISINALIYALVRKDGYMLRKKLRFAYVDNKRIENPRDKRKVRQLDYYTGEEIEIYETAEEAAEDNFISPTTLREVLRLRDGCMKLKKLKFEYVD